VINLAGTNQTMLLVAVRKILDSRSKAKRLPLKLNAIVTFKGFDILIIIYYFQYFIIFNRITCSIN
jgi:hypothetical protein